VIVCGGGGPTRRCGGPGAFSGNRYLIPLVGGSGGGGFLIDPGTPERYYNGGAGGGAILIASSVSITMGVSATILANGGSVEQTPWAGGGSGGAIRLVAPTIIALNSATLEVLGGSVGSTTSAGGRGLIRLERFTEVGTFNFQPPDSVVTRGSPVDQLSLRPNSIIRVASIAGVQVGPNASGSFVVPDATISNGGPVAVEIEATGIPHGTFVTLQVYPQSPIDPSVVNLSPVQATLTGTLQRTTATVMITFPYGFSRGTLRATW
jgi:hypothetical protein